MCCRGERKKMNQEQQCCQASKIAAAYSFQIDFQNSSTFVVFFGNQKHWHWDDYILKFQLRVSECKNFKNYNSK